MKENCHSKTQLFGNAFRAGTRVLVRRSFLFASITNFFGGENNRDLLSTMVFVRCCSAAGGQLKMFSGRSEWLLFSTVIKLF